MTAMKNVSSPTAQMHLNSGLPGMHMSNKYASWLHALPTTKQARHTAARSPMHSHLAEVFWSRNSGISSDLQTSEQLCVHFLPHRKKNILLLSASTTTSK